MVDLEELQGLEMDNSEHKAEAHRLYREHPNPATPQGRIALPD